ncbi:RibD family protein [Paeniroseomonas aquatica]|uniref:RibD family protein n=1 Tax=Paeniroseomonas aquatica TaxID=373043 RepID=UPI00360D5088
MNAGFAHRITRGLPLVTLKLATTLDGRIATASGESQWITGPAARREAHALRARHDAMLVGSGTVLADDPELTCRIPGMARVKLARVVADSRLRTPRLPAGRHRRRGADLDRHPDQPAPRHAGALYRRRGADPLGAQRPARRGAGRARPRRSARGAGAAGVTRVLAEGGAGLAAGLLRGGFVNRLAWFHAPGIMGGDGLPAVQPLPLALLSAMPRFRRVASRALGEDWLSEFEEMEAACSPES